MERKEKDDHLHSGADIDHPNYKEKFSRAEQILTGQGHSVINPAFLPTDLGDCTDYMKLCFPMIDAADAVVMLDGWEESCGACREWGYAMALEKTVLPIDVFDFGSDVEEYRECVDCACFVWCEGPKQMHHKMTGIPCIEFEEKDK